MKKTLAIVMILTLAFAMTGCGSKPESAIDKFFGAVKTYDSEGMKEALTPSATEGLGSASEYLDESTDPMAAPFVEYLKGNAAKITYEVTGTKIDGDEATVTVKCKYVDGSGLFTKIIQGLFSELLTAAFSGKEMTDEEMTQIGVDLLNKNLDSATETFTEETMDIDCIKVDGEWYVKTVTDEMADVVSSNLFTAAKGLADSFGQ
jgi:uncharacterized lipoprotein YehR (DUF1307 family)